MQDESLSPKFRTADGRLTPYAFACGYVEEHKDPELQIETRIWHEGGPCYHVRQNDFRNHVRLFWESFPSLSAARRCFDKAISKQRYRAYYKEGTIDCWTVFPYSNHDDPFARRMYIGCDEDGRSFSQWGEGSPGSHNGKRVPYDKLPLALRQHIANRLAEGEDSINSPTAQRS